MPLVPAILPAAAMMMTMVMMMTLDAIISLSLIPNRILQNGPRMNGITVAVSCLTLNFPLLSLRNQPLGAQTLQTLVPSLWVTPRLHTPPSLGDPRANNFATCLEARPLIPPRRNRGLPMRLGFPHFTKRVLGR